MSVKYYECSECGTVNQGDGPCPTCQAKSSFAAPAGSVTLDYQTAHDAELMLWNYLYCMDRGIIPPKEGWVRQAVAETRKKLADVTRAATPNQLKDRE